MIHKISGMALLYRQWHMWRCTGACSPNMVSFPPKAGTVTALPGATVLAERGIAPKDVLFPLVGLLEGFVWPFLQHVMMIDGTGITGPNLFFPTGHY